MEKLTDGHIVDWNDNTVMKRLFERFYLPLRSFAFRHVGDDSITDVRNACLNYLKRKRVEARHEQELAREMSEQESVDAALEEEVTALVYEALKELSEQARRIVLQTMEGASNAEIAERLEISVNTVKTLKLRAYRILRERLKGIQWLLFLHLLLD